jgi:hypothetical protein
MKIRQGEIVIQMTQAQRNQRSNIRNAYLLEDVDTMKEAQRNQDEFGKACLQEMIDECIEAGVSNYGLT